MKKSEREAEAKKAWFARVQAEAYLRREARIPLANTRWHMTFDDAFDYFMRAYGNYYP